MEAVFASPSKIPAQNAEASMPHISSEASMQIKTPAVFKGVGEGLGQFKRTVLKSEGAMASKVMQLIKSERHLHLASDDTLVMKQVLDTHAPDGREVDVRPLLHIIHEILHLAAPTVPLDAQANLEGFEDKTNHIAHISMLEALAFTIHKIAIEITCKCSGGGDVHATTMAVFNTLASYAWEAKIVLVLAAFALFYGQFWLTAKLHTINPLAKLVGLLKQLPDIVEHPAVLKPCFEALNTLEKTMLDVTLCIIELTELPSEYISPETPPMAMALTHIPTAVYWTIRSIVACTSQIMSLIGMGHEYVTATTEAWELSGLAHKVSNIHGLLCKQLEQCRQYIDEKKHIETYHMLERLFETVQIDNTRILKFLLATRDELPIIDGITKQRVSVEVLRRKTVVLFVSDLEVSQEELTILTRIYNETHLERFERQYEVVWLPVVEKSHVWDDAKRGEFLRLAELMPWYSLHHPSLLDSAVIRFIREKWNFVKKPLLTVLDAQGKVVCPNAVHMMLVWGSLAYPFTSTKEESLWRDETWRLDFLLGEIDSNIVQWIREGRHICLYGGEDIEWIRKFTAAIRRVSQESRTPIDMVYVGKSNPKERVRKIITIINEERLDGALHDPARIWHFWARLESMWYSKMQHGRSIEDDPIVQEIMTMLSFDGGDQGWALISKGSTEMVKAPGKKMMDCLAQFETWRVNIDRLGFIPALSNALAPFHTHEHCTRLILPGTTAQIQEKVACAECKRPMEKFVLYRCCTD